MKPFPPSSTKDFIRTPCYETIFPIYQMRVPHGTVFCGANEGIGWCAHNRILFGSVQCLFLQHRFLQLAAYLTCVVCYGINISSISVLLNLCVGCIFSFFALGKRMDRSWKCSREYMHNCMRNLTSKVDIYNFFIRLVRVLFGLKCLL